MISREIKLELYEKVMTPAVVVKCTGGEKCNYLKLYFWEKCGIRRVNRVNNSNKRELWV